MLKPLVALSLALLMLSVAPATAASDPLAGLSPPPPAPPPPPVIASIHNPPPGVVAFQKKDMAECAKGTKPYSGGKAKPDPGVIWCESEVAAAPPPPLPKPPVVESGAAKDAPPPPVPADAIPQN